jgi:fatty-acyl-CoA synthase
MDLSVWIERWAAFAPDTPALTCDGSARTYRALAARIAGLACALGRDLGVGGGDRVAFLGANCPELVELLFATARIGAITVPLNWRLAIPELADILDHCAAAVLVCDPAFAGAGAALAEARPGLKLVGLGGEFDSLANAGGKALPARGTPDSPVLIVYTSGTTGRPRGAVLTQDALFWNAVNSTHMHDLTSADVVLTSAPMFHVGGLNIQTLPALHAGARAILHRRFDAGAVLAAIAEQRPTLTVLVPAQMTALIDHPDWARTDLSSLRMVTTGSTLVPHDLIHAFHARGVPVVQVYGTTETAPIAAYLRAGQARDHVGAAGLPAVHCALRLVDDHGREVGAGERGEVLVRGPNVMREYWNDPAATAAALHDGWFRTGDIGHRDDAGFLFIDDRKGDVIISGGENIYPAELERVLAGSADVAEAAVVGRADARWGEVPVAVVVPARPALTEAAVLALFAERIARFKHPKDVLFVERLPRNAMGKVEKPALRALVAGNAKSV